MHRLSRTVQSLLISSLGLPGFNELLAADSDPNNIQYRYTFYDEEPLPASLLAEGDPVRYRIKSHQVRLERQMNGHFTLTV